MPPTGRMATVVQPKTRVSNVEVPAVVLTGHDFRPERSHTIPRDSLT